MSSDSRFNKGKERLLLAEDQIEKKRSLSRRLGRPPLEESIKIPKIGEWAIGEEENIEELSKPISPLKSRSRVASTYNNRNDSRSRPVSSLSPPYVIHPPRVNLMDVVPVEGHLHFPPGTVSTDLTDILKSKHRQPKRPLPPLRDMDEPQQDPQFLPLEVFDDSTYEQYPVSELMNHPFAYSKYQEIDGDNYWARCEVIEYDEENQVYTIEWEGTGKRKKVARFNIRFEREDQDKFEKRIEAAKKACAQHETLLRFEARVSQMPTDKLPYLSPDDISSIRARVGMKVTGKYKKILDNLMSTIGDDFKRVNNRLEYQWDIEHNPLIPNREDFLELFPPPEEVPENGVIDHEPYDFKGILETVLDNHLMGVSHIQTGLYKIWNIFQDSESLTFLTDGFGEELKLEDFVTRQYSHLDATTKTFKNSIQETLEGVISSTVTESINTIKPKEMQRYQSMITLTTRMLHTILMQIVHNTLERYLSLYSRYLPVDKKFLPDPQFSISLHFDEENKLTFSPTIEKFKDELISLLSQLDNSVNQLPIITSPIVEIDTPTVSFQDCIEQITEKRATLVQNLEDLFSQLEEYREKYQFLETILGLNVDEYAHDFDPNGHKTLDEYRSQLRDFNKTLEIIQNEIQMSYILGLFHVSCHKFKEVQSERITQLIHNFLSQVKMFALQSIVELKEEFEEIQAQLQKMPQTPEELAEQKKYLENVYETVKIRSQKMGVSNERFSFLEEFHFEITNEELDLRYKTLQMPQKISGLMDETERKLSVERIRMIRELRSNQKKLETETLEINDEVANFISKFNDLDMTIEAVDQVNELHQKLQVLKEHQDKYNQHEKLFNFEQVQSRVLQKLVEDFTPLHTLWNLANDWITTSTGWLDTSIIQIKAEIMNQFIMQSIKKLIKLKKELVEQQQLIEKVINPLSTQIDMIKRRMPLLTKLKHPGIKTKHWEQISGVVGFAVQPSMEMSLQNFLDLNLERWAEQINEIANVAAQEYNLESSLDQMDSDLQTKQFVTVQFRETTHFILHEIDDIISTIDDQLVTTQTLLTSPFIAPIKKRAVDRLAFLRNAHETLDNWVNCQRSWLYLQPIFTGTSIQQKLFKEARDWGTVDKIWSSIMSMTHNHPEFNNVMHRDTLLPDLQQCNDLLDSITHGLNAYLESKRLGFPRFFFLSNDELISILSHTKDFSKIQDSMQKLFEYVNNITVTDDLEITHMNDAEGESVKLKDPVDGNTAEIEDWLNNFEEEMHASLKDYTRAALASSAKKKREQWIGDYPAQVILIANQILWTQQVTSVLKSKKLRGLKLLQTKFIEQLDGLTALIRQPISKLLRQVVSCLLIFEVHNRDIITGLIADIVTDVNAFKWVQQLRYYWEEETIMVRSINNTYEYSYEYAGNSARLVITPLTDRCYQTLLSAFKQNLSGAPSGPAGTGKTETVRDCAKALGRPCVVYNCSEEVTPEQMSQFFAGLSSSGTWSCFDEFNRINIEVLSVIAQQVRTIQNAIVQNAETFVLDQRTLKLNVNAAICITMNPGYAGRTELPDNLKALFRPCAMMVPDFQFICEILLFSGGFTTASKLSIKLVALFDLCRKQLSNAHHYDWGLRATKAILSTAGKRKRNDLEADEALLLVHSIRDCTSPRLVSVDLPLFEGIIHDVFPEVSAEKEKPAQLVEEIKNCFSTLNQQPLPIFINKALEYYETTLVRHGIMLVGGAMGGKSSSWKVLQMALTNLSKVDNEQKPVHVEHLNPKSITIAELYGSFNPITSEWADGVLSQSIRECSFSEQTELKWIIVDGPVDSLWIESMNSLLDDNKVLCLPNNERIQLGPHVKMVFEVDDLSQASPATVSRCGMIYFDPSSLTWEALCDTWSQEYSKTQPEISTYLRGLMDQFVPQMCQFVQFDAKTPLPINPNFVVENMLRIIDCFADIMRQPEEKQVEGSDEMVKFDPLNQRNYFSQFIQCEQDGIPYFEGEQALMAFERVFIFSLIWSFGAAISQESRATFDSFLKDLIEKNGSRCPFQPKQNSYEVFIDFSRMIWLPWCDENTNMNFTASRPLEEQMIPTNETASIIFLSKLMMKKGIHLLIQGPETSKSLLGKTLVNVVLDKKEFACNSLPLANCSTPTNISRFMLANMNKHKGAWGPLPGQQLVFYFDNLGSVKPEIYGAQPPLELLRQFMDYGGWYNTATVDFMNIVKTTILATMGQPGGGLFGIPMRLLHHFYYIHLPKYQDGTLYDITSNLLAQQLQRHHPAVRDLITATTTSMLSIYSQCTSKLLPIPSKLHYVFSLRNIVRVIKGIMLVQSDNINSDVQFIRLWYHEMMREYNDRFNTVEDRQWFSKTLNSLIEKNYKMSLANIAPTGFIMYNMFADTSQKYKEVTNTPEALLTSCTQLLDDANRDLQKPIDIVLFSEAVDHLSSLSRIFAMTRGNAMLVGMKSSGRKSLTRLALYMAGIEPFEIAITRTYGFNEWREDLKNLIKLCGQQDQATGFIITDVQIIMNTQLEDISNLLINCEIPLLFEREEMDQIRAEMAQTETSFEGGDIFQLFMERVKKNLHIILVFSPYGSVFKDSMLSFTALRSETIIDWYMPWSQDALLSVARASLTKGNIENINPIISVVVDIHKSVEEFATQFFKETKRFTSVTPSRYFELLQTFQSKLKKKKEETETSIKRYSNGVEQIKTTRAQIETMSEQLDRDIPVLEKTKKEVEDMLKELQVKRGEVEETRSQVQEKSEIAEKEANEAGEANRIAQEQLALAQPLLEEAHEAVMKLDKNSLVEIKKLHQPSSGMIDTFDCVCIMFNQVPAKVDGPSPGEKREDYWPKAVGLLNDVKFINNIQQFKIENITKEIIAKLKKYIPPKKEMREDKRKAAVSSSTAVGALYDWVCASFDYWFVYQEILPKKLAAEDAAKKLAITEAILADARKHLAEVEATLKALEDKVTLMQEREQELQDNVSKTQSRLNRAQKIMSGLSGETARWSECALQLQDSAKYILGDSLLISGVLTYIGAFSPSFRNNMINKWKTFLKDQNILFTENFSIATSLGNEGVIRDWIVKGLPNDTHSIENALIITQNDQCFPLLIDPQLSGTKWLRSIEGDKLNCLRFDQSDFLQRLKSCVSFGLPVLITNVGLKLDPLIDPILSRELMNVDGQKRVTLGGEFIPYNDAFRLYISTKYPNPHYSPEVCSQVTLINFTTTQDGLTDLLLNNLIEVEREELDKKRIQIQEANAENTQKLKEIEEEILEIVSNAGSDILDDDAAINTLTRAQKTSADIAQQMEASKKTEKEINEFKEKFSVVAERAALLYFCVSDFAVIDPMYQFSLNWFVLLFRNALTKAPHPSDLKDMIEAFHHSIAITFYESVSYSLFSRHKLLFSTLMAIRILHADHKISGNEIAFMLSPIGTHEPNPTKILSEEVWSLVGNLHIVSDVFSKLVNHIKANEDAWHVYVESQTPETDSIPYDVELTSFQKLIVLRVFHLQKMREGLRIFIEENLGTEFVTPPTLNLSNVFKDSNPMCPLIFIIMPGIDPQDEILSVAASMELDRYFKSYSLGRGRGQGAEELIIDASERGFWVLLQNCHLSLSWMPRLEYLMNNLDPQKTHPRFRLCLVTMSSDEFPIGLLYQGTKLIYEIPKGMRENVMRIYSQMNPEDYNNPEMQVTEKQLVFHLAFFHAVVLERLQFGSIGWNIPYEFNPSDFAISQKHLKIFLNEAQGGDIPFEALSYVIGELNYGGRVTDRWDRRLLLSLLKRYFSEEINNPNFSFGARYNPPDFSELLENVVSTVTQWPVVTAGEDVGLSKNASTIIARNEALGIFNSLIEVQPTLVAASESISEEQFALNLVNSLIESIPKQFNIHDFLKKFDLTNTLGTVLHHEILLYNKLIQVITDSLDQMRNGLKGLIIIDETLELLNKRLLANRIPELWLSHSFPSILTLRGYMDDLNQRVNFLDGWVRGSTPIVYRLGAFYHPEEFLTAILQVYARKHTVPFDSLSWKTTPLDAEPNELTTAPDEGIYIEGLPIEGAKWDPQNGSLKECKARELTNTLPVMHLLPTTDKNPYDMNVTYECPVFRTQTRGTGALDLPNYIISLYLPTRSDTPDHWVQRSVAAFITTKI